MSAPPRPSDVAFQVASVLDDNPNVPVPRLLAFELALYENPTDQDTRRVYLDWLAEHGCTRRAQEVERELREAPVGERPAYAGPVRPDPEEMRYWSNLCGVGPPGEHSAEWCEGFNYAMGVVAFWLNFQQGIIRGRVGNPPGLTAIGMRKSALLGRLMRGEEVRRRPCPKHKGVMWCYWGLEEASKPCPCGGTGWLPNEATETPEGATQPS
jgi:uncharacterized protein (TIGR02996 family)